MAEQHPRTKIPDSEIKIKISYWVAYFLSFIIVKNLKSTSKRKRIKNIKIKETIQIDSCDIDMARTKQTLTREGHEKWAEKECKKRARTKRANLHAKKSAAAAKMAQNLSSAPKLCQTSSMDCKAPHKLLATKAAQKAAPKQLTKPHTNYATIAMREICHFQKRVDLLIPFLPSQHLIREITHDFRMDLCFQSAAILALQEAAKTFLVLSKSANLCTIHCGR